MLITSKWSVRMPENIQMFWRYFWPSFAWALFVLILCGLPGDDLPELSFLEWLKPDKIAHLFLFGIQCFLLIKGFRQLEASSTFNKNAVLYSLALSIGYGILMEVMQTYIFIHRDGDVRDAIANAIGAFIGVWVFNRMKHKKELAIRGENK